MRSVFLVILLFFCAAGYSQKDDLLVNQSIDFHKKLIVKDKALSDYLDQDLTYGHSNGWIETKQAMLDNLISGRIKYFNIREDSLTSSIDQELGWVRFVADMNVELDGKQSNLKLKVLEIWRKKNGVWKLYARQAVKA